MDYKNPDYTAIFAQRMERARMIKADKGLARMLKIHYAQNPIDFVSDWGVTLDPRNLKRKLPALIPFVPFPRQVEWMQWILDRWHAGESGLTEKSRDMGCSVAFMSLMATLCLFNPSFVAGVGSRKEELVDRVGDPNTLFYKARVFLEHVPAAFRGGWDRHDKNLSSHRKIEIPETGSVLIGEAGENIGRGGRTSIYGVDESAFLAQPMSVEASLSQTTDCRIDLSSVNGMDNPFAEKRHGGNVPVFTFHWRDDPRKGQDWYDRQVATLNPIIVAQEIDLDYSASKEGILIPSAWVQAAIDAHVKLGVFPSGVRKGALDVADEGKDKNAFASRHGCVLTHLESWSGKGSDIFGTSERAVLLCDQLDIPEFDYDADGLGVGVRGDMRLINARPDRAKRQIKANEFRGSGMVVDPDKEIITSTQDRKGRTNAEFFANRKAQSWWHLRTLFMNTFRAVREGMEFDPDEIISIPANLPERAKLCVELSQPTFDINSAGKILIDKVPDGAKSPNHADAVMILYAPGAKKRASILDF